MNDSVTKFPWTRIHRLTVNVKAVASDKFLADCKSLPGCMAYGGTIAETKRSIGRAVLEYLAGRDVFLLMDPINIIDFHEV